MDSDKLLGIDSVIGFCLELCCLPICLLTFTGKPDVFFFSQSVNFFSLVVSEDTIAIYLGQPRSREADHTIETSTVCGACA